MYRSMLFVPGDSDKKIAKGLQSGADALILDLEDAVAPSEKPAARVKVRELLQTTTVRPCALFVRINPLASGMALDDLAAVMAGAPDGIVLPKAASPQDAVQLAHYLDAFEAQHGIAAGKTRIVPVSTEVPEALFALGSYKVVGPRLAGLTWGAEDLAAAIGAISNQNADGNWSEPYQMARSLCLFAASAAGVAAIDTLYSDFRNPEGLLAASRQARRDGFAGKIAIHPDQVAVINQAFTPSEEELAHARRVIALFDANPGAGTLSLDGRMVDMPHLVQARKIVALAHG